MEERLMIDHCPCVFIAGKKGLGHEEGPREVGGQHVVPRLERQLDHRDARHDAGVVDHDVGRSQHGLNLVAKTQHVFPYAHVANCVQVSGAAPRG